MKLKFTYTDYEELHVSPSPLVQTSFNRTHFVCRVYTESNNLIYFYTMTVCAGQQKTRAG
jgi:hypothetical protein